MANKIVKVFFPDRRTDIAAYRGAIRDGEKGGSVKRDDRARMPEA